MIRASHSLYRAASSCLFSPNAPLFRQTCGALFSSVAGGPSVAVDTGFSTEFEASSGGLVAGTLGSAVSSSTAGAPHVGSASVATGPAAVAAGSPRHSLCIARRFQVSSAPEGGAYAHITHSLVWGLWNEGNLFSLSIPELQYFLSQQQVGRPVDPHAKKSTLVRQVEELLSAEQADLAVPQEGDNAVATPGAAAAAVLVTDYDHVEDALDEADDYGDWGAEPGFEQKRKVDFMEISPSRIGERYDPIVPRSFQLFHSDISPDVHLRAVNPCRLPGYKNRQQVYAVTTIEPNEANKVRFRAGFEWCLLNIWNMNLPGELNIGAGKALYYRQVAKQNRNVLPLWALQKHLYKQHPYVWFAIATESNVAAMEAFAGKLGMQLTQDSTTSYKVAIRRMGELLDAELNAQLQCVKLNRPWDRLLVSHFIRAKAPDLRLLVRARHPIKKRVVDAYMETDILRSTRDTVQSVLSPELGDITYCCERVIRKWSMRLPSGVTLQLVETKRTPLIITRAGDEGERLEYEWVVALPQRAEKVDVAALSDSLWDYGVRLAEELEEGMEDLMAHTMSASASY